MKASSHIFHIILFSLMTGIIISCRSYEQKDITASPIPTNLLPTQTAQVSPTTIFLSPSHTATPITPPDGLINRAEEMKINCLFGVVSQITYSPDSKLLAAACNGRIYLYESQTLSQIGLLSNGTSDAIDISPNGEFLVSGGNLTLYQISDGAVIHTLSLQKPFHFWQSVSFSADSKMIAEGNDFLINIWRVSNGALLRTIDNYSYVTSVAFAPNGSTLAASTLPDKITLWQTSDGTWLRNFVGHKEEITSIAFSPDGDFLASGSFDYTAKIWQVKNGKLIHTLEFTAPVSDVAFSPDGQILATSSNDGVVRLWQVNSGELLQTIDNLTNHWATSVAFSPDGNLLSASTDDGHIWQWYLEKK